METCLLSPWGYPTSAVSSWGRGECWGVGERERGGRSGAYLNQPVVPALRPTCQQPNDSRFLFHCLFHSVAFWMYFSITSYSCLSLLIHLSPLPLTLSSPSLYFCSDTTKQITLTWADVPPSDCHFHFTAGYWEQLWPLDPRRLFVLATSDLTQKSNKLWRTT